MNKYNLENIRALLIEGFSEEELRLLCYDAPNFRPVYPHLSRLADKAEIVQRLLEYAEQQMQLDALLGWAKEHNPDRFEGHQPYYEITLNDLIEAPFQTQTTPFVPMPGQVKPPAGGKESSRKPDAPKLQPILYPGSQISATLKGYDPFPSHLTEHELSFLFGETGGFWSQHPIYISVSASTSPEVVLAAAGGGKTAFAQALIELGTSEGHPLPQTLPVFIEGREVTFQKIQTEFTRALLKFVRFNPVRFQNLGQVEKRFLLHAWLQRMKPNVVEVQLKSLFETDPNLTVMMEQVNKTPPLKQKEWREQSRQCLQILGFDRTFLVIDFNQQNTRGAQFCLQQIQNWATDSIMMKLFLPAESRQDFSQFLNRVKTSELTWNNEQLAQMTQWRFESLSRLADYHGKPEVLFDNDLYSKFIQQAQGNPRRLAILWRNLFEDHLKHSPQKRVFSPENFDRAVEKLT